VKKLRIVLLLCFPLLGLWPIRCLLLIDFHEQTLLGALPFSRGDRFTVAWVHSVERTPWRETYALGPAGELMLSETAFRSFGAGVPATFDRPVQLEQGWIVVKGLAVPRAEVIYLISRDDYTLTLGTRSWQLTRLIPRDHSLQFSLRWRPWWYPLVYCLPREDVRAHERIDSAVRAGDE